MGICTLSLGFFAPPFVGLSAGDPEPVELLGVVAAMTEEPSVIGELSPFMGDCPPFMALWWLITGDADWDKGCGG